MQPQRDYSRHRDEIREHGLHAKGHDQHIFQPAVASQGDTERAQQRFGDCGHTIKLKMRASMQETISNLNARVDKGMAAQSKARLNIGIVMHCSWLWVILRINFPKYETEGAMRSKDWHCRARVLFAHAVVTAAKKVNFAPLQARHTL